MFHIATYRYKVYYRELIIATKMKKNEPVGSMDWKTQRTTNTQIAVQCIDRNRNAIISHSYQVNDSVFIAMALLNSKQKI